MKPVRTLMVVIGLLCVSSATLFAQATGDYRSAATGDWGTAATWQRYNGSSWVAAPAPPTGAETITIQAADSVNINVAVSITDTLRNQGRLAGGVNLTIADGGTFQHDRDAGSLPLATWSTGSTLLMTGVTATTPDNRNQNFHHVTFNTPGLGANLNMGWDSVTIGGNITVINSGASRWQMTAPAAGDSSLITLMGDVIVTGGQFSSNGSGNANTRITIHQYGNVLVTGGNFSVSRGSQGSGTGSTRWYLHDGNFSMSGATTQNSNAANAWFIFDKAGTQSLTLGAGNTLTALPLVVNSGTTLDMGQSELFGSGRFILNAGATLATGNDGGLDSAVRVTGTVTLDTSASFTFNGSVAQITGVAMPAKVNNLVINNAAGVTLSQPTTINGVLRLQAGVFDNTIPFTLGPGGSVSMEGGSLLHPLSVELIDETVPGSFSVAQNYPNPFNPSTTIRFGLPQKSRVSITIFNLLGQVVATPFEGTRDAGVHELQFDASRLSSGVYLYRVKADDAVQVNRMILLK